MWRFRWKVREKLGSNRTDMRLVLAGKAISSAAQELTLVLSDAQIPSSVFCWNKFLLSKDNWSFNCYFKNGLDALLSRLYRSMPGCFCPLAGFYYTYGWSGIFIQKSCVLSAMTLQTKPVTVRQKLDACSVVGDCFKLKENLFGHSLQDQTFKQTTVFHQNVY